MLFLFTISSSSFKFASSFVHVWRAKIGGWPGLLSLAFAALKEQRSEFCVCVCLLCCKKNYDIIVE